MLSRRAPWAVVAFLVLAGRPLLAQAVEGGALPTPLPLFPADNWWNLDISAAPVDPKSAALISFIGTTRTLHPDFGGEVGDGSNDIYGFPYIVVDSTQAKVTVQFDYSDESDGVDHTTNQSFPFYPIPAQAITDPHWIEGGDPGNVDDRSNDDRHMLIVDRENKYLYELYNVYYDGTQWNAGSGAFFDMKTNNRRPEGWTSADAAGLAMLPGLVRYDEVYGPDEIGHAFRVTLRATNGFVYPASHTAGTTVGALPMGARLRLKATKDISSFPPDAQKIFRAMKRYGLMVADNGSDMYISGTFDTNWNNDVLNPAFGGLKASDFDVVQLGVQTIVPPKVAFAAANYSVAKTGVKAPIQVTRTGATSTSLVVNYATSNGTATSSNYTTASGALTFAPGVASATFYVPVTNSTAHQGNKSVLLSLSDPFGGVVGAQGTAVLTIVDGEIAGTVQFSAATYTAKQVAGHAVSVTVTRKGGAASGVSVAYATSDGSAVHGTDYTTATGTLLFGAGVLSQVFTVPLLGDAPIHGDGTVNLTLSSPGGGATLGAQGTAKLIIQSGDPEVQFSAATYSIGEKAALATIEVIRSGPLTGTLTVGYGTSDGTAHAPASYTTEANTLTFGPGVAAKTFTIPIHDDGVVAPSETLNLALSSPTGGALGLTNTAVLTIVTDDGAFSFNAATYGLSAALPTATIGVSRTAPLTGTASVDYATSDGTAVANLNYMPQSGTLTFKPGVSVMTFKVPLLKDPGENVTETVDLALSDPVGANLGLRPTAILSLIGTAQAGTLQFSESDYSVGSASTSVTITVTRTAGTAAGVSVAYSTVDGTALTGTNYGTASGTLAFGVGQTSQTFTVGILGAPSGDNLSLGLTLETPGGGGTLGPLSQAVLWIVPTS